MAEEKKDTEIAVNDQQSGTPIETPEGGSVDIWQGLEPNGDQTNDDLDWSAFGQRLGIEADSFDAVQSHYNSLRDSQVKFVDEHMASTVQNMMQIHQDGGDWRTYANQVSEVAQIENEQKSLQSTLDGVRLVRTTSTLEEKKAFLRYYFIKHLGMPEGQVNEEIKQLEEYGDTSVNSAVNRGALAAERALIGDISQLKSKLESAKEVEANATKSAKEKRELFERAFDESISQFEDPHGEQFTKSGQKYVRSLARSKSVNVTIPIKVAEALLGFSDKGVDLSVLVANLANMYNNKNRLPYLEKLAKENLHNSIKGVTPDVKPTEKGVLPNSNKGAKMKQGDRDHMFHKK